jgi:hypothetical protein
LGKWWKLDKKTRGREYGVEKLGAGSGELGAGSGELGAGSWELGAGIGV